MNKIMVVCFAGLFLTLVGVTSGRSIPTIKNQASQRNRFFRGEASLALDDIESLQQVVEQWCAHANRAYRAPFYVMREHTQASAYTESAWWWLTPSQLYMHCDNEERLLFALARTPLMGLSAQVVVQQLEANRERGIFLISQLNSALSALEPGGWLASYVNWAAGLRVVREDCIQLYEKINFLKGYIEYHRAYFSLYMVEDQCWKQYARELHAYRVCNGDFVRFRAALHDLYLYELRVNPQWNATVYLSDMNAAITALHEAIAHTPYYYSARVGAARELVGVLEYLQKVVLELGW